MRNKLLFIVLLWYGCAYAQEISVEKIQKQHQQTVLDTTAIQSVIQQTFQLKKEGNYTSAYDLNNWLLSKIDSAQTPFYYAEALYMQSRVAIDLGTYAESIATTKRAKAIYTMLDDRKSMAASDNLIGVGYYFKSQLDSTLHYYLASYNLKKKLKASAEQLAISAYNIGIVYEDLGRYNEALTIYNNAIDYLKQTNDPKTSFLPSVYLAMANTHNRNNNIIKAEEYTSLAHTEGIRTYGADNPEMSFVYESNSSIYKDLGQFEKAKQFAFKALDIREKYYGKTHRWTTQSYTDVAELLLKTQAIDSAEIAIKKAISIGEQVDNKLDLADAYLVMSDVLAANKKWAEALPYVEKSSTYNSVVYGDKHEFVAETHLYKAKLYLAMNNSQEATRALKEALESSQYNANDLNLLAAPFVALEALSLQFSIADTSDKLKIIDEEIALIKFVRRLYHSQQAKVFFANTTRKTISNAVSFCYSEYTQHNEPHFFEKALELVQLNTNSVLVEERQAVQQNLVSKEASTYFQNVVKLRQQWARANQELFYEETATSPNKETIDSLLNHRVTVSRQLDKAIASYTALSSEKAQEVAAVSVSELRQTMNKQQQLFQYFVGENDVYMFSITSEKIVAKKLAATASIKNTVATLRDKLIARDPINAEVTELSDLLDIVDVDPSKREITIVTDGFLAFIPFEILVNTKEEMLLEQHSIRYQAALSLWNKSERHISKFDTYWSGFGVAYVGAQQLPKGVEEIKTIAKLTQGNTFFNQEATKEALFEQGKKSEILHVALHGSTNAENSLYSKFLLKDTSITASEIYNNQIKSKLVVLSACETGYGSVENGEGVMSLSRAFTYAGAQSTVMSLWEVPDAQTAQLMVLFYEHLEAGEPKDVALRNAKLDYVTNTTNKNLKHPYYWAGFVISGDVSPVKSNPQLSNYMIFGGVLVLVGFGLYGYRKAKKAS
ncbi:CHAT domain-containing protein [Rasiella rasia]|uniref:CHAT domain-containing protein n=1 Tax=Rasiella rasia TaxID=2744027 RepID=A0A6G6GMD8_9FLAO|nr:CHAT domain-containing tetratricopeptide repeat protein [Rasiella rasia]QIE59708.1 CHAT domain-containing protein [Rasiella rasia]